jgi:hypothetical protein
LRFYRIVITDPATGKIAQTPSSVEPSSTYSSFANGKTLPGALNVEIDAATTVYDNPASAAFIKIWGISLAEISRANDLSFKNIAVYAGFQKGLPLANPAQARLIVQGQILQAFGNWINTDMTLDLMILPATGSPDAPANIVINWKAGTQLAQALGQTLAVAFPSFTAQINISPNLVLPNDETGFYQSLTQFAQWLKQRTAKISPVSGYKGVDLSVSGIVIVADDGATDKAPKSILFQDLIGQPTWIDSPIIQFKCPMRGDLNVNDVVTLPQTPFTTTSAIASSLINLKTTFAGTFTIQQIRHVGSYRQPMAEAWSTTFDAFPNTLSPAAQVT